MDAVGSAVVTGGARGIGRGIAERLVRRGYAVVVTDVDEAAAQRCAEEVGAAEGRALDVRDPEAHRAAAAAAGGTVRSAPGSTTPASATTGCSASCPTTWCAGWSR